MEKKTNLDQICWTNQTNLQTKEEIVGASYVNNTYIALLTVVGKVTVTLLLVRNSLSFLVTNNGYITFGNKWNRYISNQGADF